MFEKEAEDGWQNKDLWYKVNANESSYKTGFKDGYNKANEWHNIKENPNDLPNDGEFVLANNIFTTEYVKFKKRKRWQLLET